MLTVPVMKKRKLSFDEALKLVKQSRAIVNLNIGFEAQLRAWEQRAHGAKVAEPMSSKNPVKEITSIGVIDFVEAEMND